MFGTSIEGIPGTGIISNVNGTHHDVTAAQSSADLRAEFTSETMEVQCLKALSESWNWICEAVHWHRYFQELIAYAYNILWQSIPWALCGLCGNHSHHSFFITAIMHNVRFIQSHSLTLFLTLTLTEVIVTGDQMKHTLP